MSRDVTEGYVLAQQTIRRFPGLPHRTLARYLVQTRPALYANADGVPDINLARAAVRYYTGNNGASHRDSARRAGTLVEKVAMPASRAEVNTPYTLPPGTWLVLPDIHVPFHSPKAVDAALDYGRRRKVDGVLLLGDFQDCEALSKFRPTRRRDFNDEVEATVDMLVYVRRAIPKAKMLWKFGNHEARLQAYYRSNAPMLADLPQAELDEILRLEERGVDVVPARSKMVAGHLDMIHGHELRGGSTAVNPARWLFLKAKGCALCAHWHRASSHDESNIRGKLVATWSLGCLCTLSPDYNPLANGWTQGFGLVYLDKDGSFEVENRRILHNGKTDVDERRHR